MSKWVQPSDAEREEMKLAEEQARISKEKEFSNRPQRMTLSAKVTIRSQTNFFMGFSENISEGGVFISTLSPPGIGESIEIEIPIENSEKKVFVQGIVRWHRRRPDGAATGCGIQFVDLQVDAKQAIENLIRHLRKEPLFVDL